jgi:hypothetical protein
MVVVVVVSGIDISGVVPFGAKNNNDVICFIPSIQRWIFIGWLCIITIITLRHFLLRTDKFKTPLIHLSNNALPFFYPPTLFTMESSLKSTLWICYYINAVLRICAITA